MELAAHTILEGAVEGLVNSGVSTPVRALSLNKGGKEHGCTGMRGAENQNLVAIYHVW